MTSACRTRRPRPRPPAAGARPPARTRSALACALAAFLAFAADAAGKAWALAALRDGHRITSPGGLVRLQLVINHGAAFGTGAGAGPLWAAVSLAGFILLGFWAGTAPGRAERSGAALAAGGGTATAGPRQQGGWQVSATIPVTGQDQQ